MARTLQLLKDGGWRSVGEGFDDVNAFVHGLPFDHFKIVTEQRREFVERVKELQPEVSNRALASALGVSAMTIGRDVTNVTPDSRKARQNGSPRVTNVTRGAGDGRRDARLIVQRDTRAQRRDEKFARLIAPARCLKVSASAAGAIKNQTHL